MIDSDHIHTAFDQDLKSMNALVMSMGGLVEAAILNTIKALDTNDIELARRVVEEDAKIDALEIELDSVALRLVALRQPRAQDLRSVFAALKIGTNLERIGDYAKNMAKRMTVLIQDPPPQGASSSLKRMNRCVQIMLKETLEAYINQDAAAAQRSIERDREVDMLYNSLFREFLTYMMEDPRSITSMMHLHFMAKNLERVGDHITGIGEQVIFAVTGSMPVEGRQSADTTSYESFS